MSEPDAIIKGGMCWFEMSMSRGRKGLEIFVRTDAQLESFVKSLGPGGTDPLTSYGDLWQSVSKDRPIEVYRVDDAQVPEMQYSLRSVGESLDLSFQYPGRINLSFLRFKGIGSPEGVSFVVAAPCSRSFAKELSARIIAETRTLLRDYVVPFNINLRISSQNV